MLAETVPARISPGEVELCLEPIHGLPQEQGPWSWGVSFPHQSSVKSSSGTTTTLHHYLTPRKAAPGS